MNILERTSLMLQHFTHSERDAQAKALVLTTKAKDLLHSKEAVTVEAILGGQATTIGTAATVLLDRLCVILASPVVSNDLDMLAGTLGRWGALLTQEFHGHQHATLSDYVKIFEDLFPAKK